MIPLQYTETIYTWMLITIVLLTKDIISIRYWMNYGQRVIFWGSFQPRVGKTRIKKPLHSQSMTSHPDIRQGSDLSQISHNKCLQTTSKILFYCPISSGRLISNKLNKKHFTFLLAKNNFLHCYSNWSLHMLKNLEDNRTY